MASKEDIAETVAPPDQVPEGDPEAQPQVETRNLLTLEGNPPPGEQVVTTIAPTSQEHLTSGGFPQGTVNETELSFSTRPERPGSSDGPSQANADSTVRDDEGIRERSMALVKLAGVANPDQFISDALKGADRLLEALPAERESIFNEIIQSSLKEHPEATPGIFNNVLNSALKESPGSNLRTLFNGTVALLGDNSARTAENPNGIIGVSFQGYGKDTMEADRAAYNTAAVTAAILDANGALIPPGKEQAFNTIYNEVSGAVQGYGLLEPPPDVGARTRNTDAPSMIEQAAKLKETIGGNPSDQLVSDLVAAANNIAFAEPAEMQSKFNTAFNQLRAANPDLRPDQLVNYIADAMNVATMSNDFSTGGQGGQSELKLIRDARMATALNPRGNFAMALTGTLRPEPTDQLAFDTAIKIGATIRSSLIALDPAQRKPGYSNDVFTMMGR